MTNKTNDIKYTGKEIYFWYTHINNCKTSGQKPSVYCKENNLLLKLFYRLQSRLCLDQINTPALYKKRTEMAKSFADSGLTLAKYSKINKVSLNELNAAHLHLKYNEILQKYIAENIDKNKPIEPINSIQFIKVSEPIDRLETIQPEILDKKNTLELSVCDGIKILIQNHVSNEKIIKIINFLKDL